MDRNETLARAKKTLAKTKDKNTKYYTELNKSYHEFKNLDMLDKYTVDLYIEHINGLCDIIDEANNALPITICIFIIFIIVAAITSFSAFNYLDKGKSLKSSIIKANNDLSVKVKYENLENFNAVNLIADSEYDMLKPLIINLDMTSSNKKSYMVHYDLYIVPENDDVSSNDLMSKDVFMFNVKSNNKDSDIQSLRNREEKDGRILIFSNEVKSNTKEKLELRMWLDSNIDIKNLNKKYKFKLYIDSYVI